MNQSVEQAARKYADELRSVDKKNTYDNIEVDSCRMVAFKRGAEWQAKQMAWVSVNDKMPEDGHTVDSKTVYAHTKDVIVLYKNGVIGKGRRIYVSGINKKGWQWSCLKGEDITHWVNHPD